MLAPLFWMLPLVMSAPHPHDSFPIKDGQRVVFLGDSNMYAGMMVQYFEAYLFTRFPDRKIDVINLGLPSETVSGLSEPDHPYPRPWLFERLDRALVKTKPDWVIACYGINDGIYYPFSEERFAAYKKGIHWLVDRVKSSGARLILLTPWPFDAGAIRSAVLPASAPKFSWIHPFEGYEGVMKKYARWLRFEMATPDVEIVDIRTAVGEVLKVVREVQKDFRFAGDGVHQDASGQWITAAQLLASMGMPMALDEVDFDFKSGKASGRGVSEVKLQNGSLSFRWEIRLPVYKDPSWAEVVFNDLVSRRPNRQILRIVGLPANQYSIYEGATRLGELNREEFGSVNLTRFSTLSSNRRAAELLKLVQQRERLLCNAWLTDVGHKRPDMQVGKPLSEALPEAAALEKRIRELAQPVTLSLRLVPVR